MVKRWVVFHAARYDEGRLLEEIDGKFQSGGHPMMVPYEAYASAVRTLQDISAMGKKAGSESAAHRLAQLGEPREAE